MAGIYLHIPFCKSKCIYCGFYSIVNQSVNGNYIDALTKEMELRSADYADLSFDTIYFGGGTPSLLELSDIERIMNNLFKYFNFNDNLEITFEANPEQLDYNYCNNIKQLGVNRLSVGVQSFDNSVLKFLGRRHTSDDALRAVENAKCAEIDNISIDLIYGINERSDKLWHRDLQILQSLEVQHFSAYALTLEENSLLYKQVSNKKHLDLDEDMATRQYFDLIDFVEKSDFFQYEVSNFALKNYTSRHNSAYWYGIPYVGLGVSAHSFSFGQRSWNAQNLNAYFKQIDEKKSNFGAEILSENDKFNEYVLLRLRTASGISKSDFERQFGTQALYYLCDYFENQVDKAFVHCDENVIKLTSEGLWFADGLASNIFITD